MLDHYVQTGTVVGTGAAINVDTGFAPSMVELFCSESSVKGFWDDSLEDGEFLVTELSEVRSGEVLIGKHTPLIGTTDTQLANTRCVGYFDGAGATAIELAATAAGTAFTATTHDITAGNWASYKLTIQTGGTITITMSASVYSTEAAAIAALAATPSNEISLGYITVQATAGAIFNATTDALAGGSSGTPAAATNYYPAVGVASGGITPYSTNYYGFTIGTSALLNVVGSHIFYKAYR